MIQLQSFYISFGIRLEVVGKELRLHKEHTYLD